MNTFDNLYNSLTRVDNGYIYRMCKGLAYKLSLIPGCSLVNAEEYETSEDVVVLVDREAGGKEQLAEKGYDLHAAFGMGQMLNFYTRVGKMNDDQLRDAKQRLDELNKFLKT